jgi:hypothetical protein
LPIVGVMNLLSRWSNWIRFPGSVADRRIWGDVSSSLTRLAICRKYHG